MGSSTGPSRWCSASAASSTATPEIFCQLPETHVPDGFAFAADGRLFVCTTTSGGLTVLSPEGEILEEISIGNNATNCIFDGSTLYVTATKVDYILAGDTGGTFWSVETDATGPLPLIEGSSKLDHRVDQR